MKGKVVFQLDTRDFLQRPDAEREAVIAFLAAHGIPSQRFLVGCGGVSIYVRIGPDGAPWLDTWRVVAGNDGATIRCEHCPGCVRQERVEMPLAVALPQVADAFYSRDLVSFDLPPEGVPS